MRVGCMQDTIYRQAAIDAFKKELTVGESKGNYVTICSVVGYEGAKQILESVSPAQPEKRYTKADYIMALHKEYGCNLETAEKAHDMALEYLRSLSKLKG